MNLTDLFAGGTVQWAMHTTMVLDIAYAAQLLALQGGCGPDRLDQRVLSDALGNMDLLQNTAFFYHGPAPLSANCCNAKLPLKNMTDRCFPVHCDETMHAKIALVCLKDGDGPAWYRLGVFSKNATFAAKCLEAGAVFKLRFEALSHKAEENGRQLTAFLTTLFRGSDQNGRDWLRGKALDPAGDLYQQLSGGFDLELEGSGRTAEALFGGCGRPPLYEQLRLDLCDGHSVVITPPAFIQSAKNKAFFRAHPWLYDLIAEDERVRDGGRSLFREGEKDWPDASHAKVYLLKKQGRCALFLGSANCTPHGIGWDFAGGPGGVESVECLVKFDLTEAEFCAIREELCVYYKPFDVDRDTPSLEMRQPDFWGELLSRYGSVREVAYCDEGGNALDADSLDRLRHIRYTIALKAEAVLPEPAGASFPFRPMEYPKEQEAVLEQALHGNTLVLTYSLGDRVKFQPTQRMLLVGTSRAILTIPSAAYIPEVPQPKGAAWTFGRALTDAWDMTPAAACAQFAAYEAAFHSAGKEGREKDMNCLGKIFANLRGGAE